MTNDTCSLSDCDKPVKRGGYCYGHYMKNWRYGTPTPKRKAQWEDLTGRSFGELTPVARVNGKWWCRCSCGSTTTVRSGDLNRGTVTTCGDKIKHWRSDDIGYSMAHSRVRQDRGSIHVQQCVGCGSQAQHWSYNHDDPDELFDDNLSSHPVAYSVKPSHYSPRCVPCHKRFDLDRRDAHRVA